MYFSTPASPELVLRAVSPLRDVPDFAAGDDVVDDRGDDDGGGDGFPLFCCFFGFSGGSAG
jgi:hypothetical protein